MKRYCGIGGQAVLEGIMMKNQDKYAVAVRKPNQEIEVKVDKYKSFCEGKKILSLPFVRGIFNFVDSMVLGIKTLMYSSEFYEEEEEVQEDTLADKAVKSVFKEKAEDVLMGLTVLFSVFFSVALFIVLPYLISEFMKNSLEIRSNTALSVVEGVVRIAIFILYIVLISLMKDIKRTYMYHGAEHKCINCIEDGKELNVENVRTSSRLHRRCGTSFLFLVMFISIVAFILVSSLMPADVGKLFKIVVRLLLIPVIAGISYEVLRLAGKNDSLIVRMISAPGMALQKLTTKEPDDSMIEVAISAVEAVFDWKQYLREQGIEVADKEEENNAVKDM
ncbi:putative uncharacterized protein [Roseburia sp. CAG:303]|nr:putative uncharacterized protein [Roseburia sp. CAG:303]